jgi:hypothetical protein
VHDGDGPGDVRVGIDLRGPAVGGPAGVADSDATGKPSLRERVFQISKLPYGSEDLDPSLAVYGEPRGVVTAVLQSP